MQFQIQYRVNSLIMFNMNWFYKKKLSKESVRTTAVAETWIIKIAF